MKKPVTITLFIFWAVVTATLTAGLVFYQNNKTPNVNTATTTGNTTGTSTPVTLTTAEVAKHNQASSCWYIVSGNVYDVTSVTNNHPGGSGTIISSCGKDATTAFQTKGMGRNHSTSAYNWLNQLKLGAVGATINQTTTNGTTTVPTGTPVTGEDD